MKRNRDRPLTPAERRSLFFVCVFLLAAIGLGLWMHLSQHEIVPPSDIAARTGEDLRILVAELSPGKARIFRFEDQKGEPIRVFVKRQDHGRMVVTFAACRRCDRARGPSRVTDGQLICGHCGEPMPILAEGATLPAEKDCTPVPVQFRIDGGSLVVRAADIEAGRPLFARNHGSANKVRLSKELSQAVEDQENNGGIDRLSAISLRFGHSLEERGGIRMDPHNSAGQRASSTMARTIRSTSAAAPSMPALG